MRRLMCIACVCCVAFSAHAATEDAGKETPEYNTIVLQGLNKVTGNILKFDGPIGTVLRFGNLEIVARRCWKAPPEDRPESAALLEISELRAGEEPKAIFLGWMFASSPGLSGLEHPVYDITVLDCAIRSSDADGVSDEPAKPPVAKEEQSKKPARKKLKK